MNIYPSNWKTLYDGESKDYAYLRAKYNYSLGRIFKKGDKSFTEFVELLIDSLDENRFEIILWANTPNSSSFCEIAILDKEIGFYHLVEFFEFDETDVYYEHEDKQLNPDKKKSIRHLIKNRYSISRDYLKIEDNPVSRLRSIQNQLIGNLLEQIKRESKTNFNRKKNNSLEKLWSEISKKRIKKYFVFGAMDKDESVNFFKTSEEELEEFKNNEIYDLNNGSKCKFKTHNDRYDNFYFIGNDKIEDFIIDLKSHPDKKIDEKFGEIDINIFSKVFQHLFKKSYKEHESENRLVLSDKQEDLLNYPQKISLGNIKMKIIEGAPGAGKTLMLARKAEEFLKEDKRVLITHFTKTLTSYQNYNIDAQTSGYFNRDSNNYPLISIMHFHAFASYLRNGLEIPPYINDNFISTEGFLLRLAANFDFKKFSKRTISSNEKFDLILIDEVQNFEWHWIKALHSQLRKNGEIWIFFDREQTVYQKVKNSKFQQLLREKSKISNILSDSFRLTESNISILNKIKKFEKKESLLYQKGQIELFDYNRIDGEGLEVWFNFSDYKSNAGFIDMYHKMKRLANTVSQIILHDKIRFEDCLILTDEHFHSSLLSSELNRLNIQTKTISPDINSFEFDKSDLKKEHFSHKLSDFEEGLSSEKKLQYEFFGIDNREKNKITLSTIHSSQGQEMSHVFVYLSKNNRIGSELLRVALTRASKNVYVFNDHFRWNNFKEHFENPLNKKRVEEIHSFLLDHNDYVYNDADKLIAVENL